MNDEELRQQLKVKMLNVESNWNRRVKRNGRSI